MGQFGAGPWPGSTPFAPPPTQWAGVSARQRRPRQDGRKALDGFISHNYYLDRIDRLYVEYQYLQEEYAESIGGVYQY